jgi:putative tryptophan/tyrosine transport system substrate-binding protein
MRRRDVLLTPLILPFLATPAPAQAPRTDDGRSSRAFRIGVLANLDTPDMEGLRQGLREQGYIDGSNVTVEWRWSEGKSERLPALATELVAEKPDVIVAVSTQAVRAAKEATRTIPIVMAAVSFPELTGLVQSLARPGGNVTGLSNIAPELNGKRLELLKEIAPETSRVLFLWNPTNPLEHHVVRDVAAASLAVGLALQPIEIRTLEELPGAMAAVTLNRADALFANGNPVNFGSRQAIAEFALKNRLPSIFSEAQFTEAGGLASYGPNYTDMLRRSALFVDRILKGAKPAELPVEQPTKFDLIVNLNTAKSLGIAVPAALLARADEVIE